MMDNERINRLTEVIKSIPINGEDELLILQGLGASSGEKPTLLIAGGQTGDPMSLIPACESLFDQTESPKYPVEVTYGDSFTISAYDGDTVHEYTSAEAFRQSKHSVKSIDKCIVRTPSQLLAEADLRFCFLDPVEGYNDGFFARLTNECGGCIFVLGAGDGTLMNNVGKFCEWISRTGVLSKNVALILNHAEQCDMPSPFLSVTVKTKLGVDKVFSVASTPFEEYADEDLDILFSQRALASAIASVKAQELGSDADEVVEKCSDSASKKIGAEKEAILAELDSLNAKLKIRQRILDSFTPFAKTVLPSANIIFTNEIKQQLHDDLTQLFQKLHNSIPELMRECLESNPDTFKYDMMCFVGDYISDVTNSGVKAIMNDVISNTVSKALDKKFQEIRSQFAIYIKEAPAFNITSENEAEYLNCVNILTSNYVPAIVNVIASIPGFLAGILANRLYSGCGMAVRKVVNALLGSQITELTIKMFPNKAFFNDVSESLQDQIMTSMSQLDNLLNKYLYPRIEGYIESSRDELISNYCQPISDEANGLNEQIRALEDKLSALESGLEQIKRLNS